MRLMSPAGMEPLGSERHGQSPQGRSAGTLRSIEPSCGTTSKLPTICVSARHNCPVFWLPELKNRTSRSQTSIWHIAECPRRESNPHLRFRKPLFFPLNYGDKSFPIFDLGLPISTKNSGACSLQKKRV